MKYKNYNIELITDYVKYKKENSDFQIPITKDNAFKATCKYRKEFMNRIIANMLHLDYELIKNSYFIDTELPRINYKNKATVLDLLLQVSENFFINLEANTYNNPSSIIKNISYGYRLVLSKQIKGEDYVPIDFVQINFDACSFPFNKKIINRFVVQEEDLRIKYPFTNTIIRVALDKLEENPYNEDMSDWQRRALMLLTSNSIKRSREIAGDYEDLNEVVNFMEEFSSIEEELMYVNKEEEEKKLKNTDLYFARQEGEIFGKNEGKIEGELASKKETIKNLTKMKMVAAQIAMAVNMPIEEVIKIQEEQSASIVNE